MSDKKHWILKIVPALAFAAGIIMASIGGVMTLSSGAKLVLFDHGPYDNVTRNQCEYNHSFGYIPIDVLVEADGTEKNLNSDKRIQKRTEEEIIKCLIDKRSEAKHRFQQDKKQGLVDGFSALVVGLIIVFTFRRKE